MTGKVARHQTSVSVSASITASIAARLAVLDVAKHDRVAPGLARHAQAHDRLAAELVRALEHAGVGAVVVRLVQEQALIP